MQGFWDNLRLALGTFWANPLRSLLTLLGIVIGVTTVMGMMALVEGLRREVNKDLSQLGANSFQIERFPRGFGRFNWHKMSLRPHFTPADREAIVSSCPSVAAAAGEDSQGARKVETAHKQTRDNVKIWGVTHQYLDTNGLTIAAGRSFSEVEELDQRRVAVLGVDVVDVLFPGLDPLNQEIRLRGRPFRVIGVFQRRGSFLGFGSQDNVVAIPLSAFQPLFGHPNYRISIQAIDAEHLAKAQDEVEILMRRRRQVKPTEPNNFEIFSNESATQTFNSISAVITAATFGVCLLSLVVGGIGILNIMLVSVTERTREIGIRKALGAKRRRILAQFSTEAVVLSLVGGLIGILLGFAVSILGRWMVGVPTFVPPWAVIVSVVMSSAVGLLFGIYPAARAARLDPVEAMRSE